MEIATAVRAELHGADVEVTQVTIDSRSVANGSLFVPIAQPT